VVFFVLSRFSISSLFSKMVAESAEFKESSKVFSKRSKVSVNSFYFFTNSCFICSNSFFSMFTTIANNYSSRPLSVTMKFIIVHCAAISGRKCGLYILVTKYNLKLGS